MAACAAPPCADHVGCQMAVICGAAAPCPRERPGQGRYGLVSGQL